ncbi:MAG: tRNA-intron lyase [Deltaproteobacteria bacterium]|nr:MAG: tRNA-intron lyase [Deltaproteobacteria bacterium]
MIASRKVSVFLLGNRYLIFDIDDGRYIYGLGFFGQPTYVKKPKDTSFASPVELSPYEALYLYEKGIIRVIKDNAELSLHEIREINKKLIEDFEDSYLVYRDLREKGFVVRSGLKFGGTFVVYEHGPGIDHAPFIVHVLPTKGFTAIDAVRAGRLANTVRKAFVLAAIDEQKRIKYYIFTWFKV